jgi:hypothetical protein
MIRITVELAKTATWYLVAFPCQMERKRMVKVTLSAGTHNVEYMVVCRLLDRFFCKTLGDKTNAIIMVAVTKRALA